MPKSYRRELEDRKIAKIMEIKNPAARQQAIEKAGYTIGNTPVDWRYWNRKPVISQNEAICLTINLDPRKYVKQLDSEKTKRYRELYDFAGSYRAAHLLRYLNQKAETYRVVDWLQWLQRIDMSPPIEWQPIGVEQKLTEEAVEKSGPCWVEVGKAIKDMRDDPEIGGPKTLEQLYEYMIIRENKNRFPNCCLKPTELFEWTAVKSRVWRERKDAEQSITNPLKNPRFLNAS